MVVSFGSIIVDIKELLKPTTAISSGTLTPAFFKVFITPTAQLSVTQKMASGLVW